ncbi:MAG: hypothetical protein UIG52_06575 [Bacteroidales bacterium]|nr:hypothetical protein [Bacteroidales bacterium]
MQTVKIIKKNEVNFSFRVKKILDTFDINEQKGNFEKEFKIDIPQKFNIGVIYGSSGSGKSTLAKELFKENIITDTTFSWNKKNSFIDDFPKEKTFDEIYKCLFSIGLSSIPSWLRPYDVLSNGEKMRANLARALLTYDFFVFDEYTSVVNREVAKSCSIALSKYAKQNNKKIILLSCHKDIIEFLEPDFTFCMDTFQQNFHLAHVLHSNFTLKNVGEKIGKNLAFITI